MDKTSVLIKCNTDLTGCAILGLDIVFNPGPYCNGKFAAGTYPTIKRANAELKRHAE